MALSVGEFAVGVGIDDAGFVQGLAGMLSRFDQSMQKMAQLAKDTGLEMLNDLGSSMSAAGDLGRVAGQAFTHNYSQSMGRIKEAVQGAFQQARDTGTFGDSLTGIAGKAATTATTLSSTLAPALSAIGLEAAAAAVQGGESFVAMAAQAVPALLELGLQVGTAAARIAQMAPAWVTAMGPIPLIIAAVAGLVALIVLNWQTIVDWTTTAFTAVWTFLQTVWNSIVLAVQTALTFLLTIVTTVWNAVVATTTAVFTGVWTFLQLVWAGIVTAVQTAVGVVLAVVTAVWDAIVVATTAVFTGVWSFLQLVWTGIVTAVQTAVGFVLSVVTTVWNAVVGVTTAVFNGIWGFLTGVWNAIVGAVQAAVGGVLGAVGWLARLPGLVGEWFGSVFHAAVERLGALISWLAGLPGRILGALGDLGNLLLGVGSSILEGLWRGLQNAAGWVKDRILGLIKAIIPGPIRDILGIGSPSKVAAELGRWVPIGLARGIEDTSSTVARATGRLAGLVTAGIGDLDRVAGPRPLTAAGAGGAVPFGAPADGRSPLRIDHFHATAGQTPAEIAVELDWLSRGGG
ncbi:hypothetical protein AB8O64_30815 [Streptomyces sp. QH1-20]|uniref:phage tail protein n=1 Tax=Streptomyces sp. QH1-20 TaxID=3240934 RepID=UPI003513BFA1